MTTLAIPTTGRRKDQINHFDITKKLEIIRDIVIVTKDDIDAPQKYTMAPKRKLNIPVGDVSTDPDYEKIVKPNYILSNSYLKYMKKIGDDEDVSIDYNMEDEDLTWISTHPRLCNDREVMSHLTELAFEKIIDILEKQTGVLKDVVPVFHVEKLVAEMLQWPAIVAAKIVPEVYQHWLNKRESLQKPICRKFWPVTNANDSCPYHVFRVRDKERYRLRKQQRKNDLESFRKMQTLKKEFNKAKILVQLVLEREKLHEAELEIQKEIFEQTLYDMSNHRGVPRQKNQYKHKLLFPELLIGIFLYFISNFLILKLFNLFIFNFITI
jgi:enhancer of polycomb-like protein